MAGGAKSRRKKRTGFGSPIPLSKLAAYSSPCSSPPAGSPPPSPPCSPTTPPHSSHCQTGRRPSWGSSCSHTSHSSSSCFSVSSSSSDDGLCLTLDLSNAEFPALSVAVQAPPMGALHPAFAKRPESAFPPSSPEVAKKQRAYDPVKSPQHAELEVVDVRAATVVDPDPADADNAVDPDPADAAAADISVPEKADHLFVESGSVGMNDAHLAEESRYWPSATSGHVASSNQSDKAMPLTIPVAAQPIVPLFYPEQWSFIPPYGMHPMPMHQQCYWAPPPPFTLPGQGFWPQPCFFPPNGCMPSIGTMTYCGPEGFMVVHTPAGPLFVNAVPPPDRFVMAQTGAGPLLVTSAPPPYTLVDTGSGLLLVAAVAKEVPAVTRPSDSEAKPWVRVDIGATSIHVPEEDVRFWGKYGRVSEDELQRMDDLEMDSEERWEYLCFTANVRYMEGVSIPLLDKKHKKRPALRTLPIAEEDEDAGFC
ncbi:hypothetical protein BV898_00838 [Hypsibius exemplaris]|uniref:Uncharacterized protein n=1 Tax=Hypsibius exemplaris TaxID=2072580 RepID=A0A1W0XCL0_HYPEX|nr:hypothetical protein BV898_00838 [Hypsibius exemplaris]